MTKLQYENADFRVSLIMMYSFTNLLLDKMKLLVCKQNEKKD